MHQERSVPTAATCVEESGQNGVLHKLNYTEIEEREWLLNIMQANDRHHLFFACATYLRNGQFQWPGMHVGAGQYIMTVVRFRITIKKIIFLLKELQ